MTGGELGFLLLGSHLGNPERKPLSPAKLAFLRKKMRNAPGVPSSGEVDKAFLRSIGCDDPLAEHILFLLEQEAPAKAYMEAAKRQGFSCITRRSSRYPQALVTQMGDHAPAVLWLWGDESILDTPCVSLVGSRDAEEESLHFAAAVGAAAAKQGFTLVSGGARGSDRAGQDGCLRAGGKVICVLPDGFVGKSRPDAAMLYLCEDSFDLGFTAQRALSRNHIIHSLGQCAFIAQCGFKGGTWNGTIANLQRGNTPVYAFKGCEALALLRDLGATAVDLPDLADLGSLTDPAQISFFE